MILDSESVDGGTKTLMRMTIILYSHAIRQNWICSQALDIGEAIFDLMEKVPGIVRLDVFTFPWELALFREAIEIRKTETDKLHPKLLAELGFPCNANTPKKLLDIFAEPSEEQLEMFGRKAKIFLSLPVRHSIPSGTAKRIEIGSGKCITIERNSTFHVGPQLHIEYRQVMVPPYPFVVIFFKPASDSIYGKVHIDKGLEYMPYSDQAFESIWTRLAFRLHMGDKQGDDRERPKLITLPDRPGDRKLAAFIQKKIGTTCGTEVKVVQPEHHLVHRAGYRKK